MKETMTITSEDVGKIPEAVEEPKAPKRKIMIGCDRRELIAYDVARGSILHRVPYPKRIHIRPIELEHMKMLTRPIERCPDGTLFCPISKAPMSTEFAISRFCVPFLEKKGLVLFLDSDVVVLDDINKLFECFDGKSAVQVVKRAQESGPDTKKVGSAQTYYARKNWSSVVLWNLDHPSHKNLTEEKLNTLPGRDLHAFCWLKDEEIGSLPEEWNHLVNIDAAIPNPKILHYTLGGPWIKGWTTQPLDSIWIEEAKRVFSKH